MNLQFQYPWVLYLLWLVPAAGLVWHMTINRRTNPACGLVSAAMAERLAPVVQPARRLWQMILFLTGLLLALLAAARPQWGMREETVYQKGRDLLIALDVSRSMLANDVHPSRLGRAKVDLVDLVKQLRGDRVGLIAFRGRPVLLCPLTTDYGFFTQALEGAGPHSAPRGETSIGDAITEALATFQGDAGSHRAIVLVSDGEDLAGRLEPAIRKAREQNVAIFTVGFGSSDGARVPAEGDKRAVLTYQGTEVLSRLNHELLSDVATRTGGAYVPVGMANVKLGNLYRDHLSRINAREQEESLQRRFIERYQLFLCAALLFFFATAFLSRGRIATTVKFTKTAIGTDTPKTRDLTPPASGLRKLALVCLLTGSGCLTTQAAEQAIPPAQSSQAPAPLATRIQPGRRGARMAQGLYLRGRYGESAAAYKAAAQSAAHRDTWLFNAGCAHLKAGEHEAAADTFRSVGEEHQPQASAAAYNLGYSLAQSAVTSAPAAESMDPAAAEQRVRQIRQAAAAFQQALKLSPEMQEGRHNLSVVANSLPQAETQALIAGLMARYGQTPPDQLAGDMLAEQRKLRQDLSTAFSNTTPALITDLESLASAQEANANLLIPLKGKIAQALSQAPAQTAPSNAPSPQQQLAVLNAFVESLRDRMKESAEEMRNLDRASVRNSEEAESGIYHLWKGIANYPALLHEDLQRQSNTLRQALAVTGQPERELTESLQADQKEAADLTSLFLTRFEQQVPPDGLDAPTPAAATNAPASNRVEKLITPETRARIITLAGEAAAQQQEALRRIPGNLPASLAPQREAYARLKEIEEMLPKQSSPQQLPDSKEQQNSQPRPQAQDQQSPQENQQAKDPPREERPDKDRMSEDNARQLLEKARQREKEHEQDIRDRDRQIPMSPAERDW